MSEGGEPGRSRMLDVASVAAFMATALVASLAVEAIFEPMLHLMKQIG